jgi:cupin superfamily acireductone dioxygenase involved in methionine salvage
MAEPTTTISMGDDKINVADLPKDIRTLVNFLDKLANEQETLETEVKEINEEYGYKLSKMHLARQHGQIQLQTMMKEFLQRQVTTNAEEETNSDDNDGVENEE